MISEPELDELDRLLGPAGGVPAGPSKPETPPAPATAAQAAPQPVDKASPYFDPCPRCRGTGRWKGYGAKCFGCDGTGGKMLATTRAERARRAELSKRRQESRAALSWGAFAEQYPDEAGWIERNPNFEFATDLKAKIEKYGSITDNQLAAIHRGLQREALRNEERAAAKVAVTERHAAAPALNVVGIADAFEAARASGIKRLGMRFEGFAISPAPATGKNPGAIYVKANDATYLGKIIAGRFLPSRDCGDQREAAVIAAMTDPLANAVAYGKRTGRCSCCGRELTDPDSIAAGIGPICASNYGF